MKLKYLALAPVVLLPLFAAASATPAADSIKVLNEKVNQLQNNLNTINSIIQTSNGSIANSMAASQHYLTAFTVVFSLIGIGIGLYINSIYQKILTGEAVNEKILKDIIRSRDETVEIEKKVQLLSEGINKNLEDVYIKLQNVEIKFILDRLIEVPEEFSLYWDKLNTHYKVSAEMQPSFVAMVKNLPSETLSFGLPLLFKYFKTEDILRDLGIATLLAERPLDEIPIPDSKKDEIIENIAALYKGGNYNPVYEKIIKTALGPPANDSGKPTYLQRSVMASFGEDYVKTHFKVGP